jgi:hypothetical protein
MPQSSDQSFPLEESTSRASKPDKRVHMPEPPPVWLIAVEDVHIIAPPGIEKELNDFYVMLLRFECSPDLGKVVYKAENFRLIVDIVEPPIVRGGYQPIMVEVPVLRDTEQGLIERELEYDRQKGLIPGHDKLVLLDPAGNWVEISEFRRVM